MEQLLVTMNPFLLCYFIHHLWFVAPQDYISRNQSTLITGSTTLRFFIAITDDSVLEETEQFSVLLQLPSDGLACGITLGIITTATVSIIDNDGM